MSVIKNTQHPELTLCKRSSSICYHAIHESAVMGESQTTNIGTNDNPANLASEVIGGGRKRNHLV